MGSFIAKQHEIACPGCSSYEQMSTSDHWVQHGLSGVSCLTNLDIGSHGRDPSAASAARPLSSSASSSGSAGSSSAASSCTSAGEASDYRIEVTAG
jgi:hypothetical protein